MKTKIAIIVSIIAVIMSLFESSCDSKYSKKTHLNTLKVADQLFYEIYKIKSGGTLANDTYSYYLTDSAHFRKYVGTIYNDDEHLYCKSLDSNRVLVYRAKRLSLNDTIEKVLYHLSDLRKEGKYD